MSTRSAIGFLNSDGTITSVYCHHDGYLSYNGRILRDHYNTPESVLALIKMGDMSSLDKTIEESVFYGRDRGEDINTFTSRNKETFVADMDASGCEFFYLFCGDWYYTTDISTTWKMVA